MHDTSIIVLHTMSANIVGWVSVEVVSVVCEDIFQMNRDEVVAIRSYLLVKESNRMANLMYDRSFLELKNVHTVTTTAHALK